MTATVEKTTGAENVRWDLTQIYPGDGGAGVENDLSRADELARTFEKEYRGRVAALDAGQMAAAIKAYEELEEILGRTSAYTQLNFTTDVADPARGALMQKVQESSTQIGTHLLFFQLEWIGVPDEAAEKLLSETGLDGYRHYLTALRRYKPHVLREPEERIVVEKSVTARSAWDRLFEEAATAIKVQVDGEELSLDQALSRMHSGDQEKRRDLAQRVTDALRVDLRTRRFIFNTILADKSIDDRLRSYPHWLADRNLSNEASDESVNALIEAVTSRYDITHRYYALKKRLLGVERFYDFDRYAPLQADEPDVSWDEAREIVLDA